MTGPRTLSPLLAAISVALAGCADPYPPTARTIATVAPPGEQAGPSLPHRAPDEPTARVLPATAADAARKAARLSTTWTAQTAAANQQRLAAISTGPARRDALQAAARLPTDAQLAHGHASSTGSIAAIAIQPASAQTRRGLIVTHEHLRAQGVHQDRWRVTLFTAVHLARGWAISQWAPQE